MSKITVYELKRNTAEFHAANYAAQKQIIKTLTPYDAVDAIDYEPEIIQTFASGSEALKALKKYRTDVYTQSAMVGKCVYIENYWIAATTYNVDDDGEREWLDDEVLAVSEFTDASADLFGDDYSYDDRFGWTKLDDGSEEDEED